MSPLGLGIGLSSVHAQSNGLLFRYAPGITAASLGASFARVGPASFNDQNGVLQTAGTGVLREWDHYVGGLPTTYLEGPRTNSFLHSDTPATHTSPALGVGTYTLWMVGTGSVAVAGSTATITGAGTAVAGTPVTFTVTVAGTVTFTVTGAPTRAQCENGAFATSYIATTAAAVTRNADSLTFPWAPTPQPATFYVNAVNLGTSQAANGVTLRIGAASAFTDVFSNVAGSYQGRLQNGAPTSASTVAGIVVNNTVEVLLTMSPTGAVTLSIAQNGGAPSVGAAGTANGFPTAFTPQTLALNDVIGGGAAGFIALLGVKVAAGVRDIQTMRVI